MRNGCMRILPLEGQDGRDSWLANTRALPLEATPPQWLHSEPQLELNDKGHVIEACFLSSSHVRKLFPLYHVPTWWCWE